MIFEQIDRIAITVRDAQKAIDFFSDLLGIRFDELVGHEGLNVRAAYSSFGLEITEPTAADSVAERFLQKRGEGVFAVVIKVTNMDEAVKIFKEKGIRFAGELQAGGLREVAFHPKDTYGVEIVLAEYPTKHPATIAVLQK